MAADWTWVVYTGLEVLIALLCCLGNALVVLAVCVGGHGKAGSGGLREPTFYFLVSLAVADFLVGVAAVPLALLLDGLVRLPPGLCLLLGCGVLVLTQASVLSLLAIAVDRYLRLHTPLRYKSLTRPSRTWLTVAICWLLACVLGFTPLFGWNNFSTLPTAAPPGPYRGGTGNDSSQTPRIPIPVSPPCTFLSTISLPFMVYFNFLGCVLLPLLTMTLLYAWIFWSLHGRLRDNSPQRRLPLLRERRLACSLALVLLLFAGCWLPLHLMNCVLLFWGPQAVTKGTMYTGIVLSHANSAVNPVVYAYRIPRIRRAYAHIWRRGLRMGCCCGGGGGGRSPWRPAGRRRGPEERSEPVTSPAP